MIWKNATKHLYLKKKISTVTWKIWKILTDADYTHRKRVCKDFQIKQLGEYHDLYVQSDKLLLVNVFGNF